MTVRRFQLHRSVDETGVSGTGLVAEGAQFCDGRCVIRWTVDVNSTAVYDSLHDVVKIHGHGGKTQVVWVDEAEGIASLRVVRLQSGHPRGQWTLYGRTASGALGSVYVTDDELSALVGQIVRYAQVAP